MHFEVTGALAPDDRKLIRDGVLTIVERHFHVEVKPIGVLARDATGAVIGGMAGHSLASWLSIDLIWVADESRGTGIGSELMKLAEAAAREAGCIGAHAHTGSFEAPGFYRRLGYTEYGSIDDFPPGHRRHSFYKRLGTVAANRDAP